MTSLSQHQRAFTLMEMLVVICIMAIIMAIAAPKLLGPSSNGRMTQNLQELSGLLEDARQYALAENTYVWVAFSSGTDTSGLNTLSVALLASNDGIDPASPSSWAINSYGSVPSSEIGLLSKIITLRQISMQVAGTFGSIQIPNLPATPTPITDTGNSLANNGGGFFSLQVPGASRAQAFTQALQFTPSGEVRNSASPVDLVELDLQPQNGNSAALDRRNIAVIRINGLTGESVIYRQ